MDNFVIIIGSCYKILNEKMLWETARQKCPSQNPYPQPFNARLVEISSSQENQFVKGSKIYMKTMFYYMCCIIHFILKNLTITKVYSHKLGNRMASGWGLTIYNLKILGFGLMEHQVCIFNCV